jgi:hypothetical protein
VNFIEPVGFGEIFGWLDRYFIFYLFITVCVVSTFAFDLTRSVWTFRRKPAPLKDGSQDIDLLAENVLKGTVTAERGEARGKNSLIPILDRVDARFSYLWDIRNARVQVIKMLAILTAILSLMLASLNIADACDGLRVEETVNLKAIGFVFKRTFYLLTAGLLATAYFYLLAGIFKQALHHRRAGWNRLRAQCGQTPV